MERPDSTILPIYEDPPLKPVLNTVFADGEIFLSSNQKTRNQFRPRAGKGGVNSYQLRQYAEATLGGGSLRKCVKLPEGEDENEWLAVNMVDFYNQINLLYGAITEFCSPQSCPEMKATDEFEYLWQDSENYKRPTKMAAPAYIEQLMTWVQANIDNESVMPSKIGVPFPKSFPTLIRQIFKRMYRVYAHIYCHHYPVIRELGLEPHLNTSFKQYVLFIDEHSLASGRDYWGPLGDLVDSIHIQNCRPQRTSTSKSDLYESRSLTTFDAIQSSTAAMLSRQVFRSLRAAAPQRAAALSVAPVRTFAAAAASEPKAPIAVFGLDGTYATALYTAASKTSTLDATAKELAKLGGILDKDAKLAGILSAPTLTPADKSAIVAELVKQAGASGATLKNFLDTLAENNRLGLLKGVTEKFGQIIAAARGEVEMTVTSAQALDPKTLSRLETAVAKSSYVGQGKKLKVTNAVNPEIVGGLIVEVGDRTIDLSVSARIAKMNKLLTDNL
ncbi:Mob1/phocein [Trichoderma camerunense]